MLRSASSTIASVVVLAAVAACGATSAPLTSSGPAIGAKPNAPESNPAGDIPDSTVYVPHTYAAGHYMITVPQGWARVQQGEVVMFTDKLNSVTLAAVTAPTAPTVVSARAREVPTIQADGHHVRIGVVNLVHRAGGDAVQVVYSADSPPDPVTGKTVRDAVERYEYFHNGTEAIVTLTGPVGADNVDPWRAVSDSLQWTS